MFIKADSDENEDLMDKFEVSTLPSFLIFKNGQFIEKFKGDALEKKVDEYSKK
jgi:thioredoxin-like negative regulator of GroEL